MYLIDYITSHFSRYRVDPTKAKTSKQAVNRATGWYKSVDSSIERTKKFLRADVVSSKKTHSSKLLENKQFSQDLTVYNFVLPHYHKGELFYKQGKWELAEQEWLKILTQMPQQSSKKLSVMYSRQNRLKDDVAVLELGIEYAKLSKTYPYTGELDEILKNKQTTLQNRINKFGDQSIGVIIP